MYIFEIYSKKSAGEVNLIKDERGNVLIYTLLLLVLVTIIGISASRTATIDIQISGNHMNYKKNFYQAEGAAMEAIQRMEGIDLGGTLPSWISASIQPDTFVAQTENAANWDSSFIGGAIAADSDLDNSKFVVLSEGVIHTGESLDMTKSKIYQYKVFGRCDQKNGTSLIEVGYRRVL